MAFTVCLQNVFVEVFMMRRIILCFVFMLLISAVSLAETSVYAAEGDTDSARVKNLQEVLSTCGYYDGEINGNFDHLLVAALRSLFLNAERELTLDEQLNVVVTGEDWSWLLRTDPSTIASKPAENKAASKNESSKEEQSKDKATEKEAAKDQKAADDKTSDGKKISTDEPSDKQDKQEEKKASSKEPEIDEALLEDPVYSNLAAGQIISFGNYPQGDAEEEGAPVEWIVLEVDDNHAFLLSRYVLDMKPYNDEAGDTTWETSSLRLWLNQEFVGQIFTKWEQDRIIQSEIKNNQGYSMFTTEGGKDTSDRIFLLSYKEASTYLSDAVSIPTRYAFEQGATEGKWWLRSPGARQNGAAVINKTGEVTYENADQGGIGVRPAMWINTAIDSRTTICNANMVNIRKKPDTSGASLGQVNKEDRIVLLEEGEEWSLIQYKQIIGYIKTQYIGQK